MSSGRDGRAGGRFPESESGPAGRADAPGRPPESGPAGRTGTGPPPESGPAERADAPGPLPGPGPAGRTGARRLPEYRFAGRTAVLTGAASGIGEQLAYGLAHRGSGLVLIDVDAERLAPVADRIRAAHPGLPVQDIVADLSERSIVEGVAERIMAEHPAVGLLINNAGVALGGRFDQVSIDQFEHVMNVNFRAPMLLTHMLIPALTASPGGHLVNVSSLFGLIAPPGQSAYSASKFALRGLSESLRGELLENGVGVTTVHPGGIRTRIAESALVGSRVPEEEIEPNRKLFAALLSYPPEKAAEQILRAVAKRKARLLIAASAKAPDLLARLLPVGHARIVRAVTVARGTGAAVVKR